MEEQVIPSSDDPGAVYLSLPRLGPRDVQCHFCKEIKERTGYLLFVLQTYSQLFAIVLSTQEVELTD